MKRIAAALAGAGLLALLLAPDALAHGLVGKQDLPIPRWLFSWAAAIVLVISFLALAVLWPTARWQQTRERKLVALPPFLDPLAGALGVAIFALGIYAGLARNQSANENLLPALVFVAFWVGLPVLSFLFGEVFRALNPWRAVGRLGGWLLGRVSPSAPAEPLEYPAGSATGRRRSGSSPSSGSS